MQDLNGDSVTEQKKDSRITNAHSLDHRKHRHTNHDFITELQP